MKKQWSTILAILLLILIALFAIANITEVPVNFGFVSYQWPLILVILGSLLAGALVTTLISTSVTFSNRREQRETEKKLHELESSQEEKINDVSKKYEQDINRLKEENNQLRNQLKDLERENKNMRATRHQEDELL